MTSLLRLSGVLIVLATSGCVSAGRYDAAVADARRARGELATARTALDRAASEREREHIASDRSRAAAAQRERRLAFELATAQAEAAACQQVVDEGTAMNQQLRAELERQGKDVEQLLTARGALASSLEQAKRRLEELRRAEAAAAARAALFRDLALRLKRIVDTGDLQIVLRSGRMVLVLPGDVLFDSGKTALNPRGKEALAAIATVLVQLQGRRFQVAGHTDDQPIRYSGFASNWELSAERALEVVRFLLQSGMRGDSLSAAGYGEFDPVASNDSAQNRLRNRRIEIALQPNVDELVALPAVP